MKKTGLFLFILLLVFCCACSKKKKAVPTFDYKQIQKRDTLIAATLYGSSSYFIFKGEEMGFDYELCERFAQEHGLVLKMVVANSQPELISLLEHKKVDLIAYRLSITNELKKKFNFTHNEYINNQVLVQRSSRKEISNVTELLGKEIYVNEGTKYEERLKNLNSELGGGIKIKTVDDSLTVDNLIEMVSNGSIEYTIAENDIALLNKTYFQNLDCKLPISFNQRSAWAVRKSTPQLAQAINSWFDSKIKDDYYNSLYNKYFIQAKFFGDRKVKIPKGAISPYDKLFKKYAKHIKWDWQLLAALSYEESRFDTSAVSWSGAQGLMQLVPRTYTVYGLTDKTITNAELNVEASAKYIKSLDQMFSYVRDKSERIKFILASYNAGPSHVLDAIALTEKYGKDKSVWYSNVEEYLLLESHREYYSDPVVKSGYFRGEQASNYVVGVLRTYEKYKKRK